MTTLHSASTGRSFNAPRNLPTGVRTGATMAALRMALDRIIRKDGSRGVQIGKLRLQGGQALGQQALRGPAVAANHGASRTRVVEQHHFVATYGEDLAINLIGRVAAEGNGELRHLV